MSFETFNFHPSIMTGVLSLGWSITHTNPGTSHPADYAGPWSYWSSPDRNL